MLLKTQVINSHILSQFLEGKSKKYFLYFLWVLSSFASFWGIRFILISVQFYSVLTFIQISGIKSDYVCPLRVFLLQVFLALYVV